MDILGKLKTAIKFREIQIDNPIFQLHYRVTSLLLLGSSFLVASKQHFGDPIDCIQGDDVGGKLIDTYCWIHSTFILPDACNATVGVNGVAHPCVDNSRLDDNLQKRHQKYYQWVYFVLFFQSACFYVPHFYWKMKESKLLFKLTEELNNPLIKEDKREEELKLRVTYIMRHRGLHQAYFLNYIMCEVFNFCNVILQIYLIDSFLGGTFTTYGLDVINYVTLEQEDRVDPMVLIFPRLTKCTFHKYGSSGDVQRHDALCILPLNILNEKIYIFMWFWFVFLSFISGLWLVYRAATYLNPSYRATILYNKASLTSRKDITKVLKHLDEGDWFLLYMIAKNMDSQIFRQLIKNLLASLKSEKEKKKSPQNKIQKPIVDFDSNDSDYDEQGGIVSDDDDENDNNLANGPPAVVSSAKN